MKKFLAAFLSAAMIISFAGCGNTSTVKGSEDITVKLSEGIEKTNVSASLTESGMDAAGDFAFELLRNSDISGESVLVSPVSVLSALSMTINGAEGKTLEEMEEVFGLKRDELNSFMKAYAGLLTSGENYKLNMANSIWFNTDGFVVNPDFLKKNASYYDADIFKAPFNDKTLSDVNGWVSDKTEGMIPSILEKLDPKENMMLLLNALCFEGQWIEFYKDDSVRDGNFTLEDGENVKASYLCGNEYGYLENSLATGFVKPYKGGKYSFAALLPNEGVKVSQLVSSLKGSDVRHMLKNPLSNTVMVRIPKFETSFDIRLSQALKAMGMESLFDENNADLSSLGKCETNLYVDEVIHKTYLSLGEQGTKAGAATAVIINKAMAMYDPEIKKVDLNRPFVYMLYDNETGLPFFLGTMTHPAF